MFHGGVEQFTLQIGLGEHWAWLRSIPPRSLRLILIGLASQSTCAHM
jgi:hypothetical protein